MMILERKKESGEWGVVSLDMWPPYSLLEVCWHFRGTYCLSLGLKSKSSKQTSKQQAETLVTIYQTTWHHIHEDNAIHENLRSRNVEYVFIQIQAELFWYDSIFKISSKNLFFLNNEKQGQSYIYYYMTV
jgi:hypothetical protein